MNNEIIQALLILKKNCGKYEDCVGCDLLNGDTFGCYITEVAPEDYELCIESECEE